MSCEDPAEEREYQRRRALKALRLYFAQQRWPRIWMTVILILTGATGFLASFLMLQMGFRQMWLRYPTALLVAWAVFLGLMRLWAELERQTFVNVEAVERALQGRSPGETAKRLKERDWGWLDWLDLGELGEIGDPEGCLAVLAMLAVAVITALAGAAVVDVIVTAPLLIAEVFLDAVLMTALYNRMRGLDRRWWLEGAVRQTMRPLLLTFTVLTIAGAVMQKLAPEAKSIGGVWHHYHPVQLEDDPRR